MSKKQQKKQRKELQNKKIIIKTKFSEQLCK